MPVSAIPKDQVWFWTPEWQALEQEADEDMRKGRFKEFTNAEEAIASLRHRRRLR